MASPLPTSFDDLLAQQGWMRRLARRLVLDEAAADDLVQQAWLDLLRARPIPGPGLRGFLATVLRRLAAKQARSAARRAERERRSIEPERALPSPIDLAAEVDLQRELVEAVLALAEPYRETVLLRWYRDLTPTAIARHLRIPVDTVETRLKRAHARLREELTKRGGGDSRRWAFALMPAASQVPIEFTTTVAVTFGALVMSKGFIATAAALLVVVTAAFVATQTPNPRSSNDGDGSSSAVATAPFLAPNPATGPRDGVVRETVIDQSKTTATPNKDAVPQCMLRVIDADGSPVVDADVVVQHDGSWSTLQPTTDTNGEIAVNRETNAAVVWIVAESMPPFHASVSLFGERATLVLPRGERIEGRVEIDGKLPRRPTTVMLHIEKPFATLGAAPAGLFDCITLRRPDAGKTLRSVTDATGRFRFTGLPDGVGGWLVAIDPTTMVDVDVDAEKLSSIRAPASDVLIPLRSKPFVSGRALGPDGLPAAEAMLTLRLANSDGSGSSRSQGQTGADGRFEMPFALASADRIELEIASSDGATTLLRREGAFSGEVPLGDVILSSPRRCRFRAVDESGSPLPGAVAFLTTDPQRRSEPTDGDGNGEFAAPAIPFTGHAAASLCVFLERHEVALVPLPADEIAIAVARLSRCTRLVVRLVPADVSWPSGLRLVADAAIDREPSDLAALAALARISNDIPFGEPTYSKGRLTFVGQTDDHGICTIERMTPNVEWRLRLFDHPGRALLAETKVTLAPAADSSATLTPPRPRTLSGRITDPAGKPLRDAKVTAYWYDSLGDRRRQPVESGTRGDGSYDLEAIFGAKADVVVRAAGHAITCRDGVAVPLEGGVLDLVIEEGHVVVCRVIDASGAPVKGASVETALRTGASDEHPETIKARAGEGGSYILEDLPFGRIEAKVTIGDKSTAFAFDAPSPEIVVQIPAK